MSGNQTKLPNSSHEQDDRDKSSASAESTKTPSAGDGVGQTSKHDKTDLDRMQKPNDESLKQMGFMDTNRK